MCKNVEKRKSIGNSKKFSITVEQSEERIC